MEVLRARSDREGFALAAAILALVVIGALVTGGFYAASQEYRASRAIQAGGEAFAIAEYGLHEVLGTWRRDQYEVIAPNQSMLAVQDTVYRNGRPVGHYRVDIRRMSGRIYFVSSTGQVVTGGGSEGAMRMVGKTVRSVSLDVPRGRALQVYGGLSVRGNSTVDGADNHPTNWEDCEDTGEHAGVVAKDTSLVSTQGNGKILGEPPKIEDPDMTDEDFLDYGDLDFDALAALAQKVYPDGTTITNAAPIASGETCDIGVLSNWGAPLDADHPCHFYFPTIYAQGDLSIASSANGQGILLVEGDLNVSGGFQFFGIVIVKGELTSTGTGAHLDGVVVVHSGGELDSSSMSAGNSIVRYSSCALDRAERYNQTTSRPRPITRRAWIDMSAAGVF